MTSALNPQLRELPVKHVPRWSGLVADPEMLNRSQFVDQLANGFQAVRNHAQRADLPAGFGDGNGDRLGMDIETDKL